jgi:putative FmdB family regulatory protein
MPTYEYVCKNCGENFEVFQSFSDKPLKKHKTCGGQLQKVFHARGIVFKGSGFYATDSKGSSKGGTENGGTEKSGSEKPLKKPEKAEKPTKAAAVSSD